MSLLEEISSILEAAGIRHALIGALALSAYGVNRASLDLDLFAADAACLQPELWADLRGRGVTVEIRKGGPSCPMSGPLEEDPAGLIPCLRIAATPQRLETSLLALGCGFALDLPDQRGREVLPGQGSQLEERRR